MQPDVVQRVLAEIDRRHAADPAGRELAYAEAMTRHLEGLVEQPSEALRVAVRAQHFERWRYPRTDFPAGRRGYLRWRADAADRQADAMENLLASCGVDDGTSVRVRALMMKRDRARDTEAQALEDCACLVFLETELERFATGREAAQLDGILLRTWGKMSEAGRRRALTLPIDAATRALLERALA